MVSGGKESCCIYLILSRSLNDENLVHGDILFFDWISPAQPHFSHFINSVIDLFRVKVVVQDEDYNLVGAGWSPQENRPLTAPWSTLWGTSVGKSFSHGRHGFRISMHRGNSLIPTLEF